MQADSLPAEPAGKPISEDMEKPKLSNVDGSVSGKITLDKSLSVSYKTKNKTIDLAIPFLGISLRKRQTCPREDFYKNIHSSFISSVQTWKCPRCSAIKKPQQSHTTWGKKKKATIYSHNMNKSQKHDGEREDIRSQLYEVLEQTTLSYQYAENSHVHTIY